LCRSGRAGDVAAGRAEVAGPRPGHVCAEVCGGGRAGAGWGAGEVSLSNHMRDWQLRYHHSKKEKYEGSAQRLGKIGKAHLKYEKSNIFKHKH